ncbi:hypothetical protein HH310_02520 [Actinoplanes sp. TBRC 11911]|uniref:hypothetical protein n=1 Tax=Actinoplanes sp. TBRC 11911 TaxID=2729386 RepID=UPI00145D5EBB|nr:hypothetical protein [Actinoplanes sp. TBRC 11911]NMO50070.1 hypothetical protein [Actinoplanes sp. TBRC 11911]
MTEESVLIDLDTPPTRTPTVAPRWRRLADGKMSVLAALGLMIASAGIGAALTVAYRAHHVRVVSISADVSLDPTPRVTVTDRQVRLDGSVTITNVGTSPISVVGLHMEPALASLNGTASNGAIYPGVASVISATVRMTCGTYSPPTLNTKASMVVAVSMNGDSSETRVTFDYGEWEMRMLLACAHG